MRGIIIRSRRRRGRRRRRRRRNIIITIRRNIRIGIGMGMVIRRGITRIMRGSKRKTKERNNFQDEGVM